MRNLFSYFGNEYSYLLNMPLLRTKSCSDCGKSAKSMMTVPRVKKVWDKTRDMPPGESRDLFPGLLVNYADFGHRD
jgi:hypothetical protein